jgi:hypothetical protein
MKHVLVALVVAPLVAAGVLAALNWIFRRRGSDFSLVASVVSQWLVAYLAWTFIVAAIERIAGGEQSRLYTTYGFVLFAVLPGLWQYRLARAGARQRAARIFMWSQVGWLLLVLAERGALR